MLDKALTNLILYTSCVIARCIGLTREVTENPRQKPLWQIISADKSGGSTPATNRRLCGNARLKNGCFYFAKYSIHTGRLIQRNKKLV